MWGRECHQRLNCTPKIDCSKYYNSDYGIRVKDSICKSCKIIKCCTSMTKDKELIGEIAKKICDIEQNTLMTPTLCFFCYENVKESYQYDKIEDLIRSQDDFDASFISNMYGSNYNTELEKIRRKRKEKFDQT